MNDTYNFRSLLMEYQRISIPKIQRDYAQGRLTGKAPDVRENLLNDIFSGKVKSLDFIFGTAQELPFGNQKKFIPLDGQQRLTTLFLLYLYGVKTRKPNIDNQNLILDKFTYETRKAARDFCYVIVNNDWPKIPQDTVPSDAIIKQKWFMNYWLNDPTVEGMLTMLDAIHKKANDSGVYPELDDISFRFFDMNEHNLSDNLYIKMNSRGKPLTAFENIKAAIDKILPQTDKLDSFKCLNDTALNDKKTFDEQWKHCIDRQWADMFWKYKENYLPDPPFIRFITNILSAYWIGENSIMANDEGEKEKFLRFLLGITGNEDYISFDKFKEVLPSKTEKEENELDNNKRSKTLVHLADGLNSFHKLLVLDNPSEICRPSWEKDGYDLVEHVLQLKGDKYNPSNKERAMFYAFVKCPYISTIETDKEKAIEKIKHWMRIFWNIVEQEQERVRNFIGAVHLVNELSSKIAGDNYLDIYDWFAEDKNEIESGFMKDQVKEERCKAKQIQKNTFKEQDIIYAESHPLLKGCISALFEDDNCEKISFGKSIKDRVELLDKLWGKDNDIDYTLVKVLISLYDKDKPESKLYLNKNQRNWKSLVTDKLKECFRNNKDNTINPNCKSWQSMLANTNLIENSREDGKILGVYLEKIVLWAKEGCTWGAYGNVILDSMHNNSLMSELLNNLFIECDQKINNCNFFSGWDIKFKYKKDNYFTYFTDNTVCLMDEKWDGKKLRDASNNNEPQNNYFFSVDESETADTFLKNLDCLIQQADSDGANKNCFNNCPNKEKNNLQS